MKSWKLHLCWAAVVVLTALGVKAAEGNHVYEMRTYYPAEGKTEAMHARFRDHTVALFEKHGMRSVGYWVPLDEDENANTLIYILEHKSKDAAAESWKAFGSDPAWQEAKAASEVDGKLVERAESVYLTPTDYSALK